MKLEQGFLLLVLVAAATAIKIDLADLLQSRHRNAKRMDASKAKSKNSQEIIEFLLSMIKHEEQAKERAAFERRGYRTPMDSYNPYGAMDYGPYQSDQPSSATTSLEKNYNPCKESEKPFPCRATEQCIPLNFVCDENDDCDDWSDEDTEICTAINRPAADDMRRFILKEKKWILPHLLGREDVDLIVHNLAVSSTVDEFKRKVGLPNEQFRNLKRALKAIKIGDEETLRAMGMPPNAWDETKFMFGKLIKSGFF